MKLLILVCWFLVSCRSAHCALPVLDKSTVREKEPFTIVCDHFRCEQLPENIQGFTFVRIYKKSNKSSDIAVIDVLSKAGDERFDQLRKEIPPGRNWDVNFHSNNRSDNRFVINLTVTVQDTMMIDSGIYTCSLSYMPAKKCIASGSLTVDNAPPGKTPKDSDVITHASGASLDRTINDSKATMGYPGGATATKAAPKNQGNFIVTRDVRVVVSWHFLVLAVCLLKTVN